jgi:hypothetical protein
MWLLLFLCLVTQFHEMVVEFAELVAQFPKTSSTHSSLLLFPGYYEYFRGNRAKCLDSSLILSIR